MTDTPLRNVDTDPAFAAHRPNATPELFAPAEALPSLKAEAGELVSWDLNARQLCDLELLMNGGFAPLTGFLNPNDYDRVLEDMRLASGAVWPIPVTLDVSADFAAGLTIGQRIALKDPENVVLAILEVQSVWQPDKSREAVKLFGADDPAHPTVRYLHDKAGSHYVGGRVIGLQAPAHYDFRDRRLSPNALKAMFQARGWQKIVAFQTRNPLHRAHLELTLRASEQSGANLLLHPVVGMTKPGDVDHYTRVRCYEAILPHYPQGQAELSLLPLAMRMGGPREALWHALIRRNCGCTHFIVGRDHAGPGKNSEGKPFFGPYDAQDLVRRFQDEIGIEMVPFKEMVYLQNRQSYAPADEIQPGEAILNLSGTELRRRLQEGRGDPGMVLLPQRHHRIAPHPSAARPPGLHRLLHRPVRRRQVDHRQCADGQADGDRWPSLDAARRRHCAQASLLGARLLQGAPQHQHPAHRLCGVRDHQEWRHRHLRTDRALCRHAPRGAGDDRAGRRLHRGAYRDPRLPNASDATARASTNSPAPAS